MCEPLSSTLGSSVDDGEFDVTFSFSAGGWFHMYLFGAAQALVVSGVLEDLERQGRRVRFAGSSAGALAAVCLASRGYRFDQIRRHCVDRAEHYRSSWRNLLSMKDYLSEAIDNFGSNMMDLDKDVDMQAALRSRLEIFATVIPMLKRKVFRDFSCFDDVKEALTASCCMAPLVGVPFRLRKTGEWVCDAALMTIVPYKNEPRTVTVSPFYFYSCSVHPTVFVPVWWGLRPPSAAQYNNLFVLGYNDMLDYLVRAELLTEDKGEALLMPEVDFSAERSALHYVLNALLVVFVRPFVVFCIYAELMVMIGLYALRAVTRPSRHTISQLYRYIRNVVSVRVFGRLVVSSKVPHNGERLSSSSSLFRVFDPLFLGGKTHTGREAFSPTGSPTGRVPRLSPTTKRNGNFGQGPLLQRGL